MKNLFLFAICFFLASVVNAQPGTQAKYKYATYLEYQKALPRPAAALKNKLDMLQAEFAEKKLQWPAKYMYIRSFKYDSELEVWVRNSLDQPFQLFKTYRVCALAGTLGPKRMEGDYQVPEGFYFINELKPNSEFHLSLGLNYPNASDRILSDALRPGSAIYIHGSCVTVGCLPIMDDKIEELYILAAHAKHQGQDFIPVHVFPVKFDAQRSVEYLETLTSNDARLKKFSATLEQAFDYFEEKRELPVILTDDRGEYIINDAVPRRGVKIIEEIKPAVRIKPQPMVHNTREVGNVANFVHQAPEFPNGTEALNTYLDRLGNEMADHLPEGINKLYLQVEFIVDSNGDAVNFKVIRGWDDYELNDILINTMEKMPKWKAAILSGKPVPKKMVVGISIEKNKAA